MSSKRAEELAIWADQANYPDPKTTSPDRWAFEFLWRNSKFRAELDVARKEQAGMKSAGKLPPGWSVQPIGRVLKAWGIDSPILREWSISDSPVRMEAFPRHARYMDVDDEEVCVTRASCDRVVLEFNLCEPVRPQIERATKILRASQKNYQGPKRPQGKNTTRLYPLYLRVLDMRAAKLSKARMQDILSAEMPDGIGDDDIRNWIKAAEELRDGGYRSIKPNALA